MFRKLKDELIVRVLWLESEEICIPCDDTKPSFPLSLCRDFGLVCIESAGENGRDRANIQAVL